jgi:hypothetical protein
MTHTRITFLAVAWSFALSAAAATRLEARPWPQATDCPACMTVQFEELEMRLPVAMVGRLFTFANASGLHFLPPGGPRRALLLFATSREKVIGKYPLLDRTTGARQFFDKLGGAEQYMPAYKAEGIEHAIKYTKASKGKLHVYWIAAAPGDTQYVQIVIDGGDTIYTLAGDVTPQWYDAMLSHLRIAPIP